MEITPDNLVYLRWGFAHVNATLVYTWATMLLLAVTAWAVTRNIRIDGPRSRWQNILEAIVTTIRGQVREVSGESRTDDCLPFIATLFLFIAASNELHVIPWWHAPTASLSTTAALAICVSLSVPFFGVRRIGTKAYLRHYFTPVFFMAPIHVISEFSRTVALAVRLFGNIMSGSMVVALLLVIAPLFFPVLIQMLDLVIGLIQAYIFGILAMVYLAAATHRESEASQVQEA